MKEFSDKVAVITGAASGIGLGLAEKLFQSLKGEKFYIPTDHLRYLRRGVKNRMESILLDLQK